MSYLLFFNLYINVNNSIINYYIICFISSYAFLLIIINGIIKKIDIFKQFFHLNFRFLLLFGFLLL